MSKSKYYSFNEIRSHQCIFNFILSNRGGGKTFGSKVMAIKDFLKTGEQFVYIRRYKSEFKKKKLFFDDIVASGLFPKCEFFIKGDIGYCNGEVICYFIALSTGLQEKSTAYPLVTKVIFDEFIVARGKQRYLGNDEVTTFLELFYTINRDRNNVVAFFLANSVTYVNPYFSYWNITIDASKRFQKDKTKQVVVELYTNEKFIEEQKNTKFGKLINDTPYGRYAIYNETLQDDNCFIIPKLNHKKIFYCSFLYANKEIGMWFVEDLKTYYIDDKINPTSKKRYTININEHKEGYINIRFAKNDYKIKMLKELFGKGLLVFKSNEIKILFYEMLKFF